MGCGSSQQVPAENNTVRNGDVKRESPPVQSPRQNEQQNHPQRPEEIRQESPALKRKDSATSKSSSSSSSSRSSSAKSKKSRPETAPGGNTPVQVELQPVKADTEQPENEQNTEAPESNNNKDGEEPVAVQEEPKSEDTPDETTTQGAAVTSEEVNNQEQEHDKPNFSEDVLKEFVEVENQVKSLEEKGAENGYQIKHARLVELHKKIAERHDKVEKLKAQT